MAKRHVNEVGNLESLFLRLEELVLANSGEDEFEEVFKLLVAKLWDERADSKRFHAYRDDQETAAAIGGLLKQAEKAWPGILEDPKSRLTPEHLTVCVDALARHTLSNEGLEVMDSFFEFIVGRAAKGAKGQYFTPRHVVELCIQLLQPEPEETVLDPACGSGGFLMHTLNWVRRRIRPEDLRKYCESKLWGFDMDPRAIRVAKTLMILAGDGSANVIRLNSLLRPSMSGLFAPDESTLTIEDVCRTRMRRHPGFDVILTNPPFAGDVREKQILDDYAVSAGKSRIERDVLFVERCVQLLRPGGKMAMVLPHNKFASDSYSYLREWAMKKAQILGIVSLGRSTFLPHTHQKASILILRKLEEGEKLAQDYEIFLAISERAGKDSKGQFIFKDNSADSLWDSVDHDLREIADEFRNFHAATAQVG